MKIMPVVAWYDLWIGVYWDARKRRLYIFPIPCVGIVAQFTRPSCGWQGFGFGAPYEDAACCAGKLYDLDSCDSPGGPLRSGGDDDCPQCATGMKSLGNMAAQRERAHDQLCSLVEDIASDDLDLKERLDVANEIKAGIRAATNLIHSLEKSPNDH